MPHRKWRGPYIAAGIVVVFAWSLTTHGKFSISGDEPHYLMIAESIRSDADLDLRNNYAQNDGRLFGHENLPAELHALPARNAELRSIHAPGIALLALPVYSIAHLIAGRIPEAELGRFRVSRGLFVASVIGVFLIAMTALGVALLTIGLANIAGRRTAVLIAVAAGVSPPVVSHSFLIFPEVFALFVTCCVVWFTAKAPSHRDPLHVIWLLLLVGTLPWFHQKYLLYTFGLLFVIALRRRELWTQLSTRARLTGLVMFMAPQVALLLWLRYEWNSFGGALTTGVLTGQRLPLTLDAFASGAAGLFFDRRSGLAAFTPLFWIVPAAMVLTFRRTWDLLVPFLLVYIPAAGFVIGWWAGFSPAARYLVPTIPLLTIPVAYALQHDVVRKLAAVLLACQLVVDGLVWQNPRWLWPSTEHNRVLAALGWPGNIYEAVLAPVRTEGLTIQMLVPISVSVMLVAIVLVLTRRERGERAG